MAPDDLTPDDMTPTPVLTSGDIAPRADGPGEGSALAASLTPAGPRQTLAMRLAERNHQRALRAERLARLRPPGASSEAAPALAAGTSPAAPAGVDVAGAALEDFLRALTGDHPVPPTGPPVEPGALLPFQRPETPPLPVSGPVSGPVAGGAPAGDLHRLPGVGPGLVWALERAGLRRLADLAPLAPAELAARLGPLGRLVPAERWIAAARAAGG